MKKHHVTKLDIDDLDVEDAEQLLRVALRTAALKLGDELPARNETRHILLEGLSSLEPGPAEMEDLPNSLREVSRQALRVFAEDPAYATLLNPRSPLPVATGRDFSLDPTSFVSVTTLALVVLSAYLDIKRDSNGRWTFQFKITPVSDKLKVELIELVKKVIPTLPPS